MLNKSEQQLLRQCAYDYRCGNEGLANAAYLTCINLMQAHYQAQPTAELLTIMQSLLSAQERQDWLGLADTLEYELLQQLLIAIDAS
ncbi:hypothetical protein FJQ87_14465 [Shewanella sp. SNU WT4]|uniref:hypothetical protein n=1 Tax=Shewanella sp. SNU WT4 TaxID=2590015 RepID=UPI001129F1F6|nr:hypothetical protein [Shewanella sp. SNU WT4]QDF67718.1 hypothetical protein FJQ87_14465 [Shewanella sp. SNU WT4]